MQKLFRLCFCGHSVYLIYGRLNDIFIFSLIPRHYYKTITLLIILVSIGNSVPVRVLRSIIYYVLLIVYFPR